MSRAEVGWVRGLWRPGAASDLDILRLSWVVSLFKLFYIERSCAYILGISKVGCVVVVCEESSQPVHAMV